MVKIFRLVNFRCLKFTWGSFRTIHLMQHAVTLQTEHMAEYERRLCVRGYHVYQKLPRAGTHRSLFQSAQRDCMSYGPRFLFLVASCTSRFASAITNDGISEESGPFGSEENVVVQSPYSSRSIFSSVKIFRRRQIFVRLIFVGSADQRKFITHENFYVYGMSFLESSIPRNYKKDYSHNQRNFAKILNCTALLLTINMGSLLLQNHHIAYQYLSLLH